MLALFLFVALLVFSTGAGEVYCYGWRVLVVSFVSLAVVSWPVEFEFPFVASQGPCL